MEFSYFDIIVIVIVLFLGLKGILNGFFKEFFGFLGIIGGIFIASRVGESVGKVVGSDILKLQSGAAVSFTGFLITLLLFWLFMLGVGVVFKKLSSISGLSIFDRVLGFVFSASKFFLIASVIAYAASNMKAMKTNIDSVMKKSVLFPMMVETGSVVMKLDPIEISDDLNKSIGKSAQMLQESATETLQNSTLEILEDAKNKISESIEQNISTTESK